MRRMSWERFELELVRIKNQVGPEHRGLFGAFYDINNAGRRCFIGQLCANTGIRMLSPYLLDTSDWIAATERGDSIESQRVTFVWLMAMEMNDAGVPWHQIVDMFVPLERQTLLLSSAFTEEPAHA